VLGFKGGTAAMFFYNLPRPSVDLDFDLLDPEKKEIVFSKMKEILSQYGKLNLANEKRFTLIFILSYGVEERNIKVDVSKRTGNSSFEKKNYLGIPMLVMNKADMTAGKLAALLTRDKFAMRDVFDLCYFLRNEWPINEIVVSEKTGLSLKEAIQKATEKVNKLPANQLLHGLADLLDEKQKTWVKLKLVSDTVFYLKLYLESVYHAP
jgi:predicted nucleotidyltransferase component of viral defense system